MAVTCETISVPASGNIVVFQSTPENASSISIRNTGASTVYLGTADSQLFPINSGEFMGVAVDADDVLYASGDGTAGTLVVLGVG